MALDTLQDLLVDEIKDIYSAEKQLVKALKKMAGAASHPELREAFNKHLEETKNQVERIEKVFRMLDMAPKAKHCNAMEGLIEEGQEIIDEDGDPTVKDAALIAAAQKVEHYEIAAYGSARAHAELLGFDEIAELIEETLQEEKSTNKSLDLLAKDCINLEAIGRVEDMPDDEDADDVSGPRSKLKQKRSQVYL